MSWVSISLTLSLYAFAVVAEVQGATITARGVRAIDGDSIAVALMDGRVLQIRMLSIDAPELGQPFAQEAKRFLDHHVRGQKLTLHTSVDERDQFGRVLAFVENDGQSLNMLMLREGLACVYILAPNIEGADSLLRAQQQAHRAGSGIWKSSLLLESPRSFRRRQAFPSSKPRALRYEDHLIRGNRKSRLAHWPGCNHEVAEANRVNFDSVADANRQGFRMEKSFN